MCRQSSAFFSYNNRPQVGSVLKITVCLPLLYGMTRVYATKNLFCMCEEESVWVRRVEGKLIRSGEVPGTTAP